MDQERASQVVLSEEQVRALGRPLRGELLSAFQNFGPTSVADVAARLGQPPKSMYYQVRKMVEVGLLRPAGSRGGGVRTEALFDVVANSFLLRRDDLNDEYRRQVNASLEQMLRTTAREFAAANEPGAERLPYVVRKTASLTPEALIELHELLERAVRFVYEHHDAGNPIRVSVTGLVVPLPVKGLAASRRSEAPEVPEVPY